MYSGSSHQAEVTAEQLRARQRSPSLPNSTSLFPSPVSALTQVLLRKHSSHTVFRAARSSPRHQTKPKSWANCSNETAPAETLSCAPNQARAQICTRYLKQTSRKSSQKSCCRVKQQSSQLSLYQKRMTCRQVYPPLTATQQSLHLSKGRLPITQLGLLYLDGINLLGPIFLAAA